MYRWSTKLDLGCVDWETRVRVKEFSLKQRKSFSRVMKKIPKALTVDTVPARYIHIHRIILHPRGTIREYLYRDHRCCYYVPIYFLQMVFLCYRNTSVESRWEHNSNTYDLCISIL